MSLSRRAMEIYDETIGPLIIAIKYDFMVSQNKVIDDQQALAYAVGIGLYAIERGVVIDIDPLTRVVTLKPQE